MVVMEVGLCGSGGDDRIVWGWNLDCVAVVVVVEAGLCGGGGGCRIV